MSDETRVDLGEDVTNSPRFTAEEASSISRTLFGVQASARPLPSERDQNFHLRCDSGREFVLKFSNSEVSREFLDCQVRAMQHVAQSAGTDICPGVHETVSGRRLARVEGGDGKRYWTRMLTWLPGVPLAQVNPHLPALLRRLGAFLGAVSLSLKDFTHPAARRTFHWDLKHADAVILAHQDQILDPKHRRLVDQFVSRFQQSVVPSLPSLRTSVIHNDANDYNLLVDARRSPDRQLVGIIDFGDMVHTCTIAELAVCIAYVMLGKPNPVEAAAHVVGEYHRVFPLTERELDVLFDLACTRLCTSVTLSALQQARNPANEYLSVTQPHAWALLERLSSIRPEIARYTFRHACGLVPCPKSHAVVRWLEENEERIGPVLEHDPRTAQCVLFDLSVSNSEFGGTSDTAASDELGDLLRNCMRSAGASIGIGRYNEARMCYTSDRYTTGHDARERRTVHLGIDLFAEAGSPVFAPLDGTVHSFQDNAEPLDYGPTIILHHDLDDGRGEFFTLYGHLNRESLDGLTPGAVVEKGDRIGAIGTREINGNWPPHLHFQVITDLLGYRGDFPGVAVAAERGVWLSICPNPNMLLRIPEIVEARSEANHEELLQARRTYLGKSLSVSYEKPLHLVRGSKQNLYDETGRAYLDAVNNVCHVGHCHPRVVAASRQQMGVLNTNTRYLHESILRYAQRLAELLPDPLRVCFLVCTGSEANDLALRLARTYSGHADVVVLDGAYHGNSSTLIDISPYKFDGRGGTGAKPHVHKVDMPDVYRGKFKSTDPQAGAKYANHVREAIQHARDSGRSVSAFFCESLLGCGGQIVLPDGYLTHAYRHVRDAGGVCVADEVQVGFGRVGTHFWGFETQRVVPDIVTLGKPMGNGHPMAAVITTPEIADAFDNGMEYFNTFGGNPISCAIGLAVLEVLEQEELQQHARRVGAHLKAGLRRLQDKYPVIGDVRGLGLFLGVELVESRVTLQPAAEVASYVVERMKDHGILISTDGPLRNVLKIKPPMVFSNENANSLIRTLDTILAEDAAQPSHS